MTTQQGSALYAQSTGIRYQDVEIPVIATRDPAATDVQYPIGKRWINSTTDTEFSLTSQTALGGYVSSVWTALGGTGVAISNVLGTADEVDVSVVGGVATLSIPATFIAPGSIEATTTLTATLGDITATDGNLVLGTAGNKIEIATGADASVGTVSLIAGTATVSTTAVSASSKIFVTVGTLGTVVAPQAMYVDAIVANTSFDITSADATDTSEVNWLIIN
jgi:hypothetical protein